MLPTTSPDLELADQRDDPIQQGAHIRGLDPLGLSTTNRPAHRSSWCLRTSMHSMIATGVAERPAITVSGWCLASLRP